MGIENKLKPLINSSHYPTLIKSVPVCVPVININMRLSPAKLPRETTSPVVFGEASRCAADTTHRWRKNPLTQ